jgi:Holliday junction resolvase RusA-like endonuclease
MKIFIDYDFINWNEYIRAERGSLYHANAIKQAEKNYIAYTVKQKYKGKYPITLTIRPHFPNKRRDLDNFRLKGLIDGLVAAGVILNDNLNCINKIVIEAVFSEETGVEVEIEESRAHI